MILVEKANMISSIHRHYIKEFSNTYQTTRLGDKMREKSRTRILQHALIFTQETV